MITEPVMHPSVQTRQKSYVHKWVRGQIKTQHRQYWDFDLKFENNLAQSYSFDLRKTSED